MKNPMTKYFTTTLVVFIALAVGFVAGCTSKSPITSVENKNVSHVIV